MKYFLLSICILCHLIPFALLDEDSSKVKEEDTQIEGGENKDKQADAEENKGKPTHKLKASKEKLQGDEHKEEDLDTEHNEADQHDDQKEKKDPMKSKQYLVEVAAGDNADMFSTNIHKAVPPNFADFGRRFIAQYPYTQMAAVTTTEPKAAIPLCKSCMQKTSSQIDDEAEERFDQAIKNALQEENDEEESLRPVKAPAFVVLAVAKQSAILESKKPVYPNEYIVDKKALRSGNYWDSFWEEEVDPRQKLRSGGGSEELKSVKVKIMPGSKLYKLVSMAKDLSPKLLYVINDDDGNK